MVGGEKFDLGDDQSVVGGSDLVPGLLELLGATLEDPGDAPGHEGEKQR